MYRVVALLFLFISTNVLAIGAFNKCEKGEYFNKFSSLSNLDVLTLTGNNLEYIEYTISIPKKLNEFTFLRFEASLGFNELELVSLESDSEHIVGTYILDKSNELQLELSVRYDQPEQKGKIISTDRGYCSISLKYQDKITYRI